MKATVHLFLSVRLLNGHKTLAKNSPTASRGNMKVYSVESFCCQNSCQLIAFAQLIDSPVMNAVYLFLGRRGAQVLWTTTMILMQAQR